MIKFHKLAASVAGIGYVGKGGGTIAAIAVCIIWFLVPANFHSDVSQVLITLSVCVLGTWSGNVVDDIWGKTVVK